MRHNNSISDASVNSAELLLSASHGQSHLQKIKKCKRAKRKRKYTTVVYNPCYGGFGLSEFATKLYRERHEKKFSKEYEGHNDDIPRDCYILVKLVKEFPDQVSAHYSDLKLLHHLRKYKGFFKVSEYDGKESPYVDIAAYKLYTIESIASSALNADEQMRQVKAVLTDDCEDAEVLDALPTEEDGE